MPQGELNGWSYAYTDEGSGPPIVLLHGIVMDRALMDPQVEALRDEYRVVTIDAPGHGESGPQPLGIDLWGYAELVAGVSDQLGIERAVYGGQSMGGFTSLRLALAHPERVAGLILIDTQGHEEDPTMLAQYEAFLKVGLEEGFLEDLADVLMVVLYSQTFASKPEADVRRKSLLDIDVPSAHGMIRAVFDRDDIHPRLGEIGCPALVMHGEDDVPIELARGQELASTLRDATFVPVKDAGHAANYERPEVVNPAIKDFLMRIDY